MWFITLVSTALGLLSQSQASLLRSNASFANACASIANTLELENSTVWFSQYVPAGANVSFPDNDPSCDRPTQLVTSETCRIALYVATTNQSGISMEAWLPSNWTGRFLSTGNGGLSGCIQYEDMAYASGMGFATVGANSGHNGTSGEPFNRNEDVIRDFAWRSVHTNVLVGKSLTSQFYSRPHTKSYYLGCSTGGRQGIRSAQSFASDFDGILAGAPAVAFNNLSSWSGHFYTLTGPANSSTFIPLPLWDTIHEDIMAQCDTLDGAQDDIIEDPLLCRYDPAGLVCNGTAANATACLTPTQADTVRGIFAPVKGTGGELVYPRMQPGSEANGAQYIYYSGEPFPYTSDWFRYAVYHDPSWDPANLGPADYDAAYRINPGDSESFEGDLAPFENAGGKLLHYHGQADQIISSDISPVYYRHVQQTMGLSEQQLDNFYRFFRVSGMGHCGGGNGAWKIGQTAQASTGVGAEENALSALVRWVEEEKAPETVKGSSTDGSIVRRHCKWPYTNKYVGGEVGDPDSWICQEVKY